MIDRTIIIKNKLGLHARPAAQFVQAASRFLSSVRIVKDDQEVDGKSIMGIMTLAASAGSSLRLLIDGEDEHEAVQVLADLFEKGFGEE